MSGPLIQLVIVLIVVGVALWLINNYIPMDATLKKILNVVVIIVVLLWLLNIFGVLGSMSGMHVRRY
ncbi:MAG TPA: Thivi_2564 family membrane protein [Candidatus Competibacteraceae bacterium]|nr:Thivi_2564 family membrane protein [Candidatus Competibacteraceae bacterium]